MPAKSKTNGRGYIVVNKELVFLDCIESICLNGPASTLFIHLVSGRQLSSMDITIEDVLGAIGAVRKG